MEQQRKNCQEKAHQTLDEIFKGIDSLEEKLRNTSKGFGDNVEKNIQEMKVEGEKLKGKFKEMCDSNTDTWEEIRNGFEQSATALRETFIKVWGKFQKK